MVQCAPPRNCRQKNEKQILFLECSCFLLPSLLCPVLLHTRKDEGHLVTGYLTPDINQAMLGVVPCGFGQFLLREAANQKVLSSCNCTAVLRTATIRVSFVYLMLKPRQCFDHGDCHCSCMCFFALAVSSIWRCIIAVHSLGTSIIQFVWFSGQE